MTELIQQVGVAFEKAQQLMGVSAVKETVTGILGWIGKKVFSNNPITNKRLALIEQQKADAETINSLKANLEYVLNGNEELQKELAEKVQEIEKLSQEAGVKTEETTTITTGANSTNTILKDVSIGGNFSGNIGNTTNNPIQQTHSGLGDNIAGDKIVK